MYATPLQRQHFSTGRVALNRVCTVVRSANKEHLKKESRIVLGREDGLVFATGCQAMAGLISGLLTPDMTLVLDELAHAWLYDGALITRCRIERFRQNDLVDLDRTLYYLTKQVPALVVVN